MFHAKLCQAKLPVQSRADPQMPPKVKLPYLTVHSTYVRYLIKKIATGLYLSYLGYLTLTANYGDSTYICILYTITQ